MAMCQRDDDYVHVDVHVDVHVHVGDETRRDEKTVTADEWNRLGTQ